MENLFLSGEIWTGMTLFVFTATSAMIGPLTRCTPRQLRRQFLTTDMAQGDYEKVPSLEERIQMSYDLFKLGTSHSVE